MLLRHFQFWPAILAGVGCMSAAMLGGCSFWESEGLTVGGRAVAEESNAGNLPDDGSIGRMGTQLQDEGDDTEDRALNNLEGVKQPISDSDPLRMGAYSEEGAEEVLADDVVNLLPGKYNKQLNPVEAEKLRAKQLERQIQADKDKLKDLDQKEQAVPPAPKDAGS